MGKQGNKAAHQGDEPDEEPPATQADDEVSRESISGYELARDLAKTDRPKDEILEILDKAHSNRKELIEAETKARKQLLAAEAKIERELIPVVTDGKAKTIREWRRFAREVAGAATFAVTVVMAVVWIAAHHTKGFGSPLAAEGKAFGALVTGASIMFGLAKAVVYGKKRKFAKAAKKAAELAKQAKASI